MSLQFQKLEQMHFLFVLFPLNRKNKHIGHHLFLGLDETWVSWVDRIQANQSGFSAGYISE